MLKPSIHANCLLALAVSIGVGTIAYADVVYFVNPPPGEPGHYNWHLSDDLSDPNIWLDITRSSTDQPGQMTPSSISQHWNANNLFGDPFPSNISRGGAGVGIVQYIVYGRTYGTVIDENAFTFGGYHETAGWAHYLVDDIVESTFGFRRIRYAGIRFYDENDDPHYGWAALQRTGQHEIELDVFAWAYESEPGVPILAGVPAPGTLTLLVTSAFGFRSRRRTR